MEVSLKRFLVFVVGFTASFVVGPFGYQPSPAHATTPSNGNYVCATGLPAAVSDTTNLFKITDGVVLPLNPKCSGDVVIPSGVTSIGAYAFFLSSITSITIPDTVTSIQWGAFANARLLTTVTIPASVTNIEGYAFSENSSLTDITVHGNNPNFTSISGVLFNKAGTLLISYPIGNAATSYVVPNGVTSIAESAFYTANSLTSIKIPASLATLDDYVFNNAESLTSIYFFGNAPIPEDFVFFGIGISPKAFIKTGATGFGAVGSNWNGLTVEIPTFTVMYNSNGGTAMSTDTFDFGGLISEPTTPTRDGHIFAGWSATDGGAAVTFPYSPDVASDVNLYAKWTSTPASADLTPATPSAPSVATPDSLLRTTARTDTTSPLSRASLPTTGTDELTSLILFSLLFFVAGLLTCAFTKRSIK